MLETSHFWVVAAALLLAACVSAPPPAAEPEPVRAEAPRGPAPEVLAAAAAEEAKALLAQAETDIQRARAKRALWQQAWDGTRWRGFGPLGGSHTSAPSAIARPWQKIDVFARGTDAKLWNRAYG